MLLELEVENDFEKVAVHQFACILLLFLKLELLVASEFGWP